MVAAHFWFPRMFLNKVITKEGVNRISKTTTVSVKVGYISQQLRAQDNLPGTGDTVIKQAVPPGGDLALHLALLKPAIAQTG